MSRSIILLSLVLNVTALAQVPTESNVPGRWSEQQANDWYRKQPWLVGANYIPANAINELEMWQAETFDPKTIDKELGWAAGIGMNTMRVFLHDLLWQQDADGFKKRLAAEPGGQGVAGRDPVSTARSLRQGRGRSVWERPARSGVGRVE